MKLSFKAISSLVLFVLTHSIICSNVGKHGKQNLDGKNLEDYDHSRPLVRANVNNTKYKINDVDLGNVNENDADTNNYDYDVEGSENVDPEQEYDDEDANQDSHPELDAFDQMSYTSLKKLIKSTPDQLGNLNIVKENIIGSGNLGGCKDQVAALDDFVTLVELINSHELITVPNKLVHLCRKTGRLFRRPKLEKDKDSNTIQRLIRALESFHKEISNTPEGLQIINSEHSSEEQIPDDKQDYNNENDDYNENDEYNENNEHVENNENFENDGNGSQQDEVDYDDGENQQNGMDYIEEKSFYEKINLEDENQSINDELDEQNTSGPDEFDDDEGSSLDESQADGSNEIVNQGKQSFEEEASPNRIVVSKGETLDIYQSLLEQASYLIVPEGIKPKQLLRIPLDQSNQIMTSVLRTKVLSAARDFGANNSIVNEIKRTFDSVSEYKILKLLHVWISSIDYASFDTAKDLRDFLKLLQSETDLGIFLNTLL